MKSNFAASLLLLTCLSAFTVVGDASAQTIRQWAYPPGSCPLNQSTRDADDPALIPEGHYFPALSASDGRPAVGYALSLKRRPCGFNLGTSELRLRLSAAPGVVDWRPRLTVIQDGVEHGCTGVNWPAGTSLGYPGECAGASGLQVIPPAQVGNCSPFAVNCVNTDAEALNRMTRLGGTRTVTLSINTLQTSFDPDRAFTLRLRGNWPAGAPDAVYEIPALGTPGNMARIPEAANGMWWNPDESGSALIIDRNERGATFAAWLTYDDNGQSIWFFMSNGTPGDPGEVSGTAFAPRGEPFSAPGSNVAFAAEAVGRFTLKFSNASSVEFRWSINGRSGIQNLQRFEIRSPRFGFVCSGDRRLQQVRGLLGWGAFVEGSADAYSGCQGHATLLTYDDAGRAMWVYGGLANLVPRPGQGFSISPVYGNLFRPTGTPYAAPHDPQRFHAGSPIGVWDVTPSGVQISLGSVSRTPLLERFIFEY
ncbi:MAG: hypothetical protein SF172_13440 [Burkholderiales bacterium]|nr:hypothetical protein [Burkholderiales bacterium]